MNTLFKRLKIESVLACTIHGTRSCASFFSWLLTKCNPICTEERLFNGILRNKLIYVILRTY